LLYSQPVVEDTPASLPPLHEMSINPAVNTTGKTFILHILLWFFDFYQFTKIIIFQKLFKFQR